MTAWGWQSGWYYFTLRPGSDPAAIQAALPAWERRNIEDQVFGNQRTNQGDEQDWQVGQRPRRPYGRRAGSDDDSRQRPHDRSPSSRSIAFLILGMACVNFTNLATARASQRAREVALRKVLGANRKQLITQFLAESVLIAGIAMLLALALVELLASKPSPPSSMRRWRCAISAPTGCFCRSSLLTLLVGAAGGVYPAFYLSRFQPAQVLKANKSTAEAEGSGLLRNVLVVAQFAVSIGLIICTAVVYAQTIYARNMRPRLPPRRPDPGRESRPPAAARAQRGDRRADAARARRGLGRPLRDRGRHQQQQQYRRSGARPERAGDHRHLQRRPRFLPDDGDRAGRRPAVRREPPGRPDQPPLPAAGRRRSALWSPAAPIS